MMFATADAKCEDRVCKRSSRWRFLAPRRTSTCSWSGPSLYLMFADCLPINMLTSWLRHTKTKQEKITLLGQIWKAAEGSEYVEQVECMFGAYLCRTVWSVLRSVSCNFIASYTFEHLRLFWHTYKRKPFRKDEAMPWDLPGQARAPLQILEAREKCAATRSTASAAMSHATFQDKNWTGPPAIPPGCCLQHHQKNIEGTNAKQFHPNSIRRSSEQGRTIEDGRKPLELTHQLWWTVLRASLHGRLHGRGKFVRNPWKSAAAVLLAAYRSASDETVPQMKTKKRRPATATQIAESNCWKTVALAMRLA